MGIADTTITHIRRSPYQATVAVLTMFLTFLVIGFFFLLSVSSAVVLGHFESKPQITVFFADSAGETEAAAFKRQLEQTGKVASVTYVSKEEALAIYREQNKNDPLLLEMVTADILPASLEISATDPKYLTELAPILQSGSGVEEVVYQKDVVDALLVWTNAVRIVGAVLVGLLALNSFLIVMTVIGMKIALKRQEVEILTLVGAAPWYVRGPFLLEGALYGVAGSVLASLIIIGLVLWLRPFLLSFLGIIPTIAFTLANPTASAFLAPAAVFFVTLASTGAILGGLASFVAVGRYLKF